MRALSIIAVTLALFTGMDPLHAYYYHSGYYNREGGEAYNNAKCGDECDNSCQTCGYQDYWYQGSMNPLVFLQFFSTTEPPHQTLNQESASIEQKKAPASTHRLSILPF